MNYCHRCQSNYEKPGTCNCFAEGGDAKPAPLPVPVYPAYPHWYRWRWDTPWWSTGVYVPIEPVTITYSVSADGEKWVNSSGGEQWSYTVQ